MDEVKEFIEMLRDPNPGVRCFALQRLGQIGDRRLIPVVKQATQDPDQAVAVQAEQSLTLLLGRSLDEPRQKSTRPDKGLPTNVDAQSLGRLRKTGLSILSECTRKLIAAVDSPNLRVAQSAVHALGKIGDVAAADALARGLTREIIAQDCAMALAGINDPKVVEILLAILDSPDQRLVRVVLAALDSCRDERVILRLLSLIHSQDPQIRADAVFLLGELSNPSVVEKILFLLNDSSELVVSRTIDALRKLNYDGLVDTVVLRFADASNRRVRATLLTCLLHHPKDDRVISLLESALKDSDSRVRANAVEAVASLKIPVDRKLALLSAVQDDSNNRVLANLAIALGPSDSLMSLKILTKLLNSPDKWERASAVYAAGFVKESKVGTWLSSTLMYEDDEDVIRNIVTSLSRFRDPTMLDQLLKGLTHNKAIVRSGTARILGNIADRSARPALMAAIEAESSPTVKAEMISALARLSDTSHIPQIARFLKDPDPRVQANCIDALDQLGSLEIIPYVKPFITSLDNRVKANAAKALWTQGTLEVVSTLSQMLDSATEREVLSAIYALGEIGRTLAAAQESNRYFILSSSLKERARELGDEATPAPRVVESQLINKFIKDNWRLLNQFSTGHYREALLGAEQAIGQKPSHPTAQYLAGEIYRRIESFEKAAEHLARAEDQNDQFIGVLTSLANLHHQTGDTRSAVIYQLKALRRRVDLVAEEIDTALTLVKGERLEDATLLLKALLDQVPMSGRLHRDLGRQACRYGDLEKSFRHLFLAALEEPAEVSVLHDLAVVANRLGYQDTARLLATQLLSHPRLETELQERVRSLLSNLGEDVDKGANPNSVVSGQPAVNPSSVVGEEKFLSSGGTRGPGQGGEALISLQRGANESGRGNGMERP